MKTLHVGIASYDQMKAWTLAVARGERRVAQDDPKVWFISIESFARILSTRNRDLLELIVTRKPVSLTELATMSGRAKSNLSRTLKTMARVGLVELVPSDHGKITPRVLFDRVKLDLRIGSQPAVSQQAAA